MSVNNKNVEIDPVFCRPRPPPTCIFLVDMYILTSYTTYQVSHKYLILNRKQFAAEIPDHSLHVFNYIIYLSIPYLTLPITNTLIDTNKAFSYYLVGISLKMCPRRPQYTLFQRVTETKRVRQDRIQSVPTSRCGSCGQSLYCLEVEKGGVSE